MDPVLLTACHSIIIPVHNEEKWLARTLPVLKQVIMDMLNASGEVIVVDNNSTDGSARITRQHRAQVVF